jgi:hypothetical protein
MALTKDSFETKQRQGKRVEPGRLVLFLRDHTRHWQSAKTTQTSSICALKFDRCCRASVLGSGLLLFVETFCKRGNQRYHDMIAILDSMQTSNLKIKLTN